MDPANLDSYGGDFHDEIPVEDSTSQLSSTYYTRLASDAAQMTRTSVRAWASFTPTATAAPLTFDPAVVTARSWWGAGGGAQKPVVTKTATGLYQLTWPPTLNDELSVPEDVAFLTGWAVVMGTVLGSAQIGAIGANAVAVRIYNSSAALADLTTDVIAVFLL